VQPWSRTEARLKSLGVTAPGRRRGFMLHEDLTLQLGCLPPAALRALLQGKVRADT